MCRKKRWIPKKASPSLESHLRELDKQKKRWIPTDLIRSKIIAASNTFYLQHIHQTRSHLVARSLGRQVA
jgi:hypothetical protein